MFALAAKLQVVSCVVLVVATSSAAGAPPKPLSPAALLTRYVPVLVLHPDEALQPVPVDGFLADSDLTRKTASGWETVPGLLPSGGAELRLDQRLCRASDGLKATPCYAAAEAAHGATPVVYGAAFRTRDRIDLQYWFWYPYDDFSPGYPASEFWQAHEGDWEAVSVILDRAGRPVAAVLAASEGHASRVGEGAEARPSTARLRRARIARELLRPGVQPLVPPATEQAVINVMKAYGIAVPADHTEEEE